MDFRELLLFEIHRTNAYFFTVKTFFRNEITNYNFLTFSKCLPITFQRHDPHGFSYIYK